jgi:membrane-associated phospholipid phosphatase
VRRPSPMELRVSEWIGIGYFAYLAAMARFAHVSPARKRRVVGIASLLIASIVVLGTRSGSAATIARDWMPLLYVLFGYWLPANLAGAPNSVLERTLLDLDHRLFGMGGLSKFVDRAPRFVIESFELAYLFCYPLLPIGFASLLLAGFRAEVDQFWTTVMLASFMCYGFLPWLPTRAPRAIEAAPPRPRWSIRTMNLLVLDRASVQLNTFPSGHTAASLATALAVGAHSTVAGFLLALIAVSIAAGSVVGRYHYAADAVTGAVVAFAAFALSRFV